MDIIGVVMYLLSLALDPNSHISKNTISSACLLSALLNNDIPLNTIRFSAFWVSYNTNWRTIFVIGFTGILSIEESESPVLCVSGPVFNKVFIFVKYNT